MTPITSYSLGVNLIPYHEFSSTVRPEVRQEILEYMEAELEKYEQSRKKKSSEEADRLRAEGNTHYQRKNFDAALHAYTMSILYAPVQSEGGDEADKKSSSLALGYGNRSATFFEIGQWASVLADIEHALEAGHQGVGKLLLRKADALINLRKFEMAKVVLKDSRLKQDPSLEGTVIGRLVTVERSLRAAKAQQSPLNEINIPPSEFPPLSEIISSLSTFTQRRGVIWWPRSHFAGEILAVELPYASVLVKKEELSYCHHCCRRLKTDPVLRQVTVREGGSALYRLHRPALLLDGCRQAAWTSYHQYECSILPMLYNLGLGHLALRMLFTLNSGDNGNGNGGFSQAKDVIRRADHDPDVRWRQGEEAGAEPDERAALRRRLPAGEQQLREEGVDAPAGQLRRHLGAAPRAGHSRRLPQPAEPGDADDVHLVGGLLHRHLMQLSVNAHAINDYIQAMPEEGGSQLKYRDVPVSSGLYPWISLLNHSCEPNVIPTFECGRLFLLRALAPIAVGEEVVNSYCVHFARMEVKERQERLLDRYNFVCKCPRCELELKDGLNGRYIPLKCKSCPNGLMTRKDEDNFHCNACSKTVPQEEIKRQYNAFTEVLEKAWKSLKLDKPLKPQDGRFALTEKAADQAQAMLATRLEDGTVVFGSSRAQLELGRIADLLANMYLLYGRPADATRLIKRSRAIVEAIYGPMAILLVHELSKEVDILARLLQADVIVPLLRGGREATEREVALIDDWKQQYKRMMTLMGRYSLSGARLPLGDPDSCYFTSQILQRRKWMKEFDGVLRSIVEKRQLRNAAGRCTSKLQQMLLEDD
ncbi:SET and MYND domain-containing protein 4 [Tyrophagus putrescentiae]|nr:SET and MYND domain-containing protein 4 [Tyrophagus putrescentiae]